MTLLKVNLWDYEFAHMIQERGFDSSSPFVKPIKIEYIRNEFNYEGITIFTNNCLDMVYKVNSNKKIAWLLEARVITPNIYNRVIELEDQFDCVLTNYKDLLERNPNKYKFMAVAATTWIPEPDRKIYNKIRLCSLLVSHKQITESHRFRHVLAQFIKGNNIPIDIYGGNYIQFPNKIEAHRDYMFSIVIMNSCESHYFNEAILDCFMTGTIPVFYGCPSIGEFFNIDGIVHFTDFNKILEILPTLSNELYYSKLDAIKDNFERAQKYISPDDTMVDILLTL